jgi:hypothetical protein
MSSKKAETVSSAMRESSMSRILPGGLAVSWVERRKARRPREVGLGDGVTVAVSVLGVTWFKGRGYVAIRRWRELI